MLEYLRAHILEEVDGAIDYMEKAVAHKGTQCGATFYAMSVMESEHANTLYRMFSKMSKEEDLTDKQYSEMLKSILDKYMNGMARFETLKKLYYAA